MTMMMMMMKSTLELNVKAVNATKTGDVSTLLEVSQFGERVFTKRNC